MLLKKWGEVKNERGYIGALIGGIILLALGLYIVSTTQISQTLVRVAIVLGGFLVGFYVGHTFDRQKTIIYKEEE